MAGPRWANWRSSGSGRLSSRPRNTAELSASKYSDEVLRLALPAGKRPSSSSLSDVTTPSELNLRRQYSRHQEINVQSCSPVVLSPYVSLDIDGLDPSQADG